MLQIVLVVFGHTSADGHLSASAVAEHRNSSKKQQHALLGEMHMHGTKRSRLESYTSIWAWYFVKHGTHNSACKRRHTEAIPCPIIALNAAFTVDITGKSIWNCSMLPRVRDPMTLFVDMNSTHTTCLPLLASGPSATCGDSLNNWDTHSNVLHSHHDLTRRYSRNNS